MEDFTNSGRSEWLPIEIYFIVPWTEMQPTWCWCVITNIHRCQLCWSDQQPEATPPECQMSKSKYQMADGIIFVSLAAFVVFPITG
jgi:hypothetical protein